MFFKIVAVLWIGHMYYFEEKNMHFRIANVIKIKYITIRQKIMGTDRLCDVICNIIFFKKLQWDKNKNENLKNNSIEGHIDVQYKEILKTY